MKRTVTALGLLLATACAGSRPAWRASAVVGKTVEVSAPDLNGREVRVSRAAAKVTVVDFWATWCDPCRDQLPFLDRLAQQYRGDVSVFGVSFDEDRAAVENFVKAQSIGFPVLWDKGGATLAERLDVTRLPTTLVIDRYMVVRAVHLGFKPSEEEAIEAEVRRLLAE